MTYTVHRKSKNRYTGSYTENPKELNCTQERAAKLFRIGKAQDESASTGNYSYEFFIVSSNEDSVFLYSDSANG